jgi:hypothetical protein
VATVKWIFKLGIVLVSVSKEECQQRSKRESYISFFYHYRNTIVKNDNSKVLGEETLQGMYI